VDFCNYADEHQTAPVVAVVIGGGHKTFQKASELLTSGSAVLVFSETGGAADFIAGAYDAIQRNENKLVYNIRHKYNVRQIDSKYMVTESLNIAKRETKHSHHSNLANS